MEQSIKPLLQFLEHMQTDPRIRTTHIAAYMALYQLWLTQGCPECLEVKGKVHMHLAKISSSATWHRAIRFLNEFGYILYCPTFNKMASTVVYMNFNPKNKS
ncbi:MAG: hypothetical protein V4594_18595 [Bacteroidota bacterium]